jgi:hypothetical protein
MSFRLGGLDFTLHPSTTLTIVLSYFSNPFYFCSLPSPDSSPITMHFNFLPWWRPKYPLLSSTDPTFFFIQGSALSSSPREKSPSPRSVNSRGPPWDNRLLHSRAHIADSPTPRLLRYLFIRGAPIACCAPALSQIRHATLPLIQ